jgi:fumarylpyruvate hydrolase
MTRRDLQLVAREQGRPWDLGKDFEKSAVCTAILPVGNLGVLDKGASTCRSTARPSRPPISRN